MRLKKEHKIFPLAMRHEFRLQTADVDSEIDIMLSYGICQYAILWYLSFQTALSPTT